MRKRVVLRTVVLLMMPGLLVAACGINSPEFTPPPATISLPAETPTRLLSSPTAVPPATRVAPTAPPSTLPAATGTLTAEQREASVLELIHLNARCRLPCWWGITPGTTTWAQAQMLLESVGAQMVVERTSGKMTTYSIRGLDLTSREISLGGGLIVRDGVVEEIEVGSFTAANPSHWLEAWAGYSPQQVMLKYGAPTRVWLSSHSGYREPPGPTEGSPIPYEFWLFYDAHRFQVHYGGVLNYGAVYQFCPEFGENGQLDDGIGFYLTSSDNPAPLETLGNLASLLALPGMSESIKPVEEATGMTTEQFARLFTQSRKVTCFDTPRSIWPP